MTVKDGMDLYEVKANRTHAKYLILLPAGSTVEQAIAKGKVIAKQRDHGVVVAAEWVGTVDEPRRVRVRRARAPRKAVRS